MNSERRIGNPRILAICFVIFLGTIGLFLRSNIPDYQTILQRAVQNGTTMADRAVQDVSNPDLVRLYQQGWTKLEDPGFLEYIRRLVDEPPTTITTYDGNDVSQEGQSLYVDDLLKGRRNGFFIECGAADGTTLSNSLMFESKRGWSGLLVEANPNSYQKLLKRHRNVYSINACLSTNKQTAQVEFLAESLIGGIKANMDSTQQKFVGKSGKKSTVTAQCFPLYSMLLALRQTHVDFFSLDVEGPELEILYTIPLEIIIVDVFCIEFKVWYGHENKPESQIKLNKIRNFFTQTGLYNEVKVTELDVFFKRKPQH